MFVKCIWIDTVIIYKYLPLKEITKPGNVIGSMRYTGVSIRYTYGTVNLRSLHFPVCKLFLTSAQVLQEAGGKTTWVRQEISWGETPIRKEWREQNRKRWRESAPQCASETWERRGRQVGQGDSGGVQQGSTEKVGWAQRERQAKSVSCKNAPARYPCCAQVLRCGPSKHEGQGGSGQSGFGLAAAGSVSPSPQQVPLKGVWATHLQDHHVPK